MVAVPTPQHNTMVESAREGRDAARAVMETAWRSIVADIANSADPAKVLHPFDPIGLYVVSLWHSLGTHMRGCRVGPMTFACGRRDDPAALVRDAAIGLAFKDPKIMWLAALQGIAFSPRHDVFASARWLPYQWRVASWTADRFDPAVNRQTQPRDPSLARLRSVWLDHKSSYLDGLWASSDEVYYLFRAAIQRKATQTKIPAWKLWAFLWHAKSAAALRLDSRSDLGYVHHLRRRQSPEERDAHDRQAATMAICAFDARIPHGQASVARPFLVLKTGKFAWDCCRVADDVLNRFRRWERSLKRRREVPLTGVMPAAHASIDDLVAAGAAYLGPEVLDVADAAAAAQVRRRAVPAVEALAKAVEAHLDALPGRSAHLRALRRFWRQLLQEDMTIAEAARAEGCQRSHLSSALHDLRRRIRAGSIAGDVWVGLDVSFGT